MRRALTKLVTTIGPSSEEAESLRKCVAAGMNVMRLNFSHATREEFFRRIRNLSAATTEVATLLDTRGPEIRLGGLRACKNDRKAKIELREGDELVLTTDSAVDGDGDETKMFVDYPRLADKVVPSTLVLLDDGAISLRVRDVLGDAAVCVVENTGRIGERKGVNLPGVPLELPPMSREDEVDIRFGIEHGIDIIAASFVHDGAGVDMIRAHVDACVREVGKDYESGDSPMVVAKIESVEALRNLDEIIDSADGIMVARGDLGVEVPLVDVCQWQKDIVAKCRDKGKPVVVATEMLDSMSANPRPTRAEVADVTNAVLEYADAVMLSGESANGDYPVAAVQTQRDICRSTESWLERKNRDDPILDAREALALAAVTAQRACGAAAIVVKETERGATARSVARFAPNVPVLAVCDSPRVARQLALSRGVVATHQVVGDDFSPVALARNILNDHDDDDDDNAQPVVVVTIVDGAVGIVQ
ncbi:hypothetical protein CTAYLR_007154 [Chrysophaeum taylorii]|uniref:Pyruvate kinase n=1 Tax=Chrysophaeum taylorii TaxID=2483200 RepID=A0AAD7UL87_9STRA|nr:hypothetical protein CTAYLR_007154 [Chrysophaeum taylorii]